MVSDYDGTDFALAVDEQADLPVDITGKKGQKPREILSDDIFRRDALVAETLYLLDLRGAQSCRISSNFINR